MPEEPKKGAYENVYMQEMFEAVSKQQGHREKEMQNLQQIGKTAKGASKVVRFFMTLVFLAIIAACVYLMVAEPQYTYVVGAFLGLFLFFTAIVSFLRR